MKNAQILLVEDDLFLRELYTDLLTAEGFHLETAGDGETALQKILQKKFDLILLDHNLPKMTGLQILEKIKKTSSENKSIVFLTNTPDTQILEQTKSDTLGYMIKSELSPEQFVQTVKQYLPQ